MIKLGQLVPLVTEWLREQWGHWEAMGAVTFCPQAGEQAVPLLRQVSFTSGDLR